MDYKLEKVGQLKRFNSDSFLVIEVTSTSAETPPTFTRSVPIVNRQNIVARRLSTSNAHLSPTTPLKTPSRLVQIKLEEYLGDGTREVAHERELQNAIGISNVWDDFNLDDKEMMETNVVAKPQRSAPNEPLFICTNLIPGLVRGTPSPARIPRKQCFSPSLQQSVKDPSFTPNSLTPTSPNKLITGQSNSPIILRPSPLSFNKRKNEDTDSDGVAEILIVPKKKCKAHISGGLLSTFGNSNINDQQIDAAVKEGNDSETKALDNSKTNLRETRDADSLDSQNSLADIFPLQPINWNLSNCDVLSE